MRLTLLPLLLAAPVLAVATTPVPAQKQTDRTPLTPPEIVPENHVAYVWELPGVVYGVDVPETLSSQGIPVRLHAVRSTWKIDDVFRHVHASFTRARLFIPPEHQQLGASRGYVITGLDVLTLVAYTAYLQPDGPGTLIVFGESFPAQRQDPRATRGFAPTFPGARNVVEFRSESGDSMTYTAPAMATEVVRFYRSTLTKAGFREEDEGEFLRAGERLRVTAFPRKEGGSGVRVTLAKGAAVVDSGPPH